jgi:4'-phosphopantetheinyl transferase
MRLGPTDVHVRYRLTDTSTPADLDDAAGLLSSDERDRRDRFVFPEDRRDYCLAHALVRRLVGACAGVAPGALTFDVDARGKPSPAPRAGEPSDLQFNLSHTRGLVACAMARGADVGVDVERIGRDIDDGEIARRFFSPAERRELEACGAGERARRFIDLWTLKEACLKATGAGLSESLDAFSFAFPGEHGLAFTGPSGGGAWRFALFAPTPMTRLAVAVRSRAPVDWAVAARADDGAGVVLKPLRQGDFHS